MKPTTTKPSYNWREGRRLRAWELAQQGWPQRKIAEALGVSHGAVGQWISRAKRYGVEALRHHPGPGATPKLATEQRAQLPALLGRGAEAFGFRGQVWTAKRVAIVIEREFGVRYHPTHVSRLLKALRWSPQKPVHRASQRDEAKIAAWYTERWPALKKGQKPTGEPLSG